MSFDPNANPESVASRAAELSLEQLERFRSRLRLEVHKSTPRTDGEVACEFYAEPFEVQISNKISALMAGYAVLKGYVTEEQASR